MKQIECRHFNGYKPCGRSEDCSVHCSSREIVDTAILIVHLGALGAVVRSTALLAGIKRKYPRSKITWVTDKPADQILKTQPHIDRLLTTESGDLLTLAGLQFDVAMVIDKSLKATGVLAQTRVRQVFGFKSDGRTGAILPATPSAVELWNIGLSDQLKFHKNKKSENQLVFEALDLGAYTRDEYHLPLTEIESQVALQRRSYWQMNEGQPVIGLNTGCSAVIPYKKLSIETHRLLIQALLAQGYENLVLLGGPEDTERNQQISQGLSVFSSPTDRGLRDGLCSVAACDLVVTGDSLGMHMAISQQKHVVAWFGPTCAQEIELYDRGEKILTKASCSPCWKRSCDQKVMCYDQVSMTEVMSAIHRGVLKWHSTTDRRSGESSLSRQLFSEI